MNLKFKKLYRNFFLKKFILSSKSSTKYSIFFKFKKRKITIVGRLQITEQYHCEKSIRIVFYIKISKQNNQSQNFYKNKCEKKYHRTKIKKNEK